MAKRWFSGVAQVRDERPLAAVPRPIRRALMLVLLVQVAFHAMAPSPDASVEALRAPPDRHIHEVSALGEPVFVAKLTNLWLQAHDHQPGVSIPYAHLDYQLVRAWLARILALDARGQYPLMAASRLYGALRDPLKQRVMFEFVHAEFRKDPAVRWPWLAHAALTTKYQLEDLPAALSYARTLTEYGRHHPEIPFWARDLSVLLLEDMCELEAAKVLLGGMMADGRLDDPHERQFLENKLQQLKATETCTQPDLRARTVNPTRSQ